METLSLGTAGSCLKCRKTAERKLNEFNFSRLLRQPPGTAGRQIPNGNALPAAACSILLFKRIMWCARANWNRALLLNFARQFFPLKLYLVTGIVTDTAGNCKQNVSICRRYCKGGRWKMAERSRRQPYCYMETRLYLWLYVPVWFWLRRTHNPKIGG